ncbi:MAG: right-handed parallel beta-helix repeat-containing protein [Planctomycetota bacterium]|nr:right-handed parallel beta-helix repeat-containing protein [Planctomycetota bacterium]
MKRLSAWSVLVFIVVAGCRGAGGVARPPVRELDIQALLSDSRGQRVTVPLGTYVFKQGLVFECDDTTLWCEPGTWILVEDVNASVLSIHEVKNARIENAHLSHVKPLEEYECHGPVVDIGNAEGVVLFNCELAGCGAVGVRAVGVKDLTVQNCLIRDNTFNAFYFDTCEQVSLIANVIEDNANLFQMYRVTDIQSSDNLIRNNGGYWREKDPEPGMKTK